MALDDGEFVMDEGNDEEFAPSAPPPPETGMEIPGGEVEFSPSVMQEAAKLDGVAAGAIIMEIVRRAIGVKRSLKDLEHWSTSEFVAFGATLGSLKSGRMRDEPVGSSVSSIDLASYSLDTLKARLVRAKVSSVAMFTDSMLPAYIMGLKGVKVIEAMSGDVEIVVPGCSIKVVVANRGDRRGRVTAGGSSFVEWHNGVYNSNFFYLEVGEDARLHARYARSIANISFSNGKFTFVERTLPKKGEAYFKGTGGVDSRPDHLSRLGVYSSALRGIIAKAHADDNGKTSIGHSQHPLDYLEVILHNKYQGMSAASAANVRALTLLLQQEYAKVGPSLISLFPKFFSGGFIAVPAHVNELIRGTVSLPDGSVAGTFGAIASYIEHSRAMRAPADLPRKSDAYGMGVVGAGVVSVASKAFVAIQAYRGLARIPNNQKVPNVDAFGTHAKNHWEQVVLGNGSDVVFFDRERKWIPGSGAPFREENIELLSPGSRKGRTLFDDTMGCEGDFGDGDGRKYPIKAKMESIARSGYEGGFIKMYYGNASDAVTPLGRIPAYLEDFHRAYPLQVFVQGGSPHSPEWFLVFAKAKGGLSYPSLTEVDGQKGFAPSPRKVEGGDLSFGSYQNYARQWLMWKAYDLIRSNILLNTQVLFGVYKYERLPSWLHYRGPKELTMNGLITPSSRHGPVAVSGTPVEEFTVDE